MNRSEAGEAEPDLGRAAPSTAHRGGRGGEPANLPGASPRWDSRDGIFLVGLALILITYALRYVNFRLPPEEDAAMLMRYAQHLAEGHGIVWNTGEQPVDGGTDFLFLVAVAGLVKCGLALFTATRLLVLVSHVVTVFVVYLAVRVLHGLGPWTAFFSAAYLALGPGYRLVEAYFGTTFFVLAVTTAWCLAYRCRQSPLSVRTSVGFAISALVMGLIRPEGVFLAAFMLGSVLYATGIQNSRRVVISFASTFGTLGVIYFIWHWSYFGFCLPNAFYVKGGGYLHYAGFHDSVQNVIFLCFPFLPALALGLFSAPCTRRESVFALIPIVGFTLIWGLLSSEMDYCTRFQYAVLPITLLSWPLVLQHAWRDWGLPSLGDLPTDRRWKALTFLAVMAAGVLGFQLHVYKSGLQVDGHFNVGLILHDYRDEGYTLVTTEAGLVPLISEWRTMDAWGLNDRTISHRASVDDAYIDTYHPQLIEVHEERRIAITRNGTPEDRRWAATVIALESYVQRRGYRLAAAFGTSPDDLYCFYVQPGFADSDQIADRIRKVHFQDGTTDCFDFRDYHPQRQREPD